MAKIGAEGVLAVGLEDGRGLAVKVGDGAMRALDPAGVTLARDVLGLPCHGQALESLARPVVTNSRGEPVGRVEPLHEQGLLPRQRGFRRGRSFKRQASKFRDTVVEPEPGRYHLYVSWACPWAHRT